jgi:hypothetical protein
VAPTGERTVPSPLPTGSRAVPMGSGGLLGRVVVEDRETHFEVYFGFLGILLSA